MPRPICYNYVDPKNVHNLGRKMSIKICVLVFVSLDLFIVSQCYADFEVIMRVVEDTHAGRKEYTSMSESK